MTFDDGILKIYSIKNTAKKGDKPALVLCYKSSHYYGFENIGIQRYYTALEHNQQIDSVLSIYRDDTIRYSDIVQLEDRLFYEIKTIQPTTDDNGILITRLSLERKSEYDSYNIKTDKD